MEQAVDQERRRTESEWRRVEEDMARMEEEKAREAKIHVALQVGKVR